MKRFKNFLICTGIFILFVLLGNDKLFAQQDSQYTQYMYAANVINPAYVGTRDLLSITSQYRAQWIGLEGAPRTFNLTSNGPLSDDRFRNVSVGATFVSESIGPSVQNLIAGDAGYRIELNRYSTYLSFGLKAGIRLLNIDYDELAIFNGTDPTFQENVDNRLSPIIGTGVYVYSENWYGGLSVPNFLSTRFFDEVSISTAKERMTFYAMGGYVFYINPLLKFKPAFLGKFTSGAPLSFDISANFLFNDRFTIGGNYRFGDTTIAVAASLLAGFQANNSLFIGVSYDLDVQGLGAYNSGTPGLLIRYDVGQRNDRRSLASPRFF